MLIPGLTFVLVAAIILGTYWVLLVRPERATETSLRRRLGGAALVRRENEKIEREPGRLSSVPILNHLLLSRVDLIAPVKHLVDQSGAKTTVGTLLLGVGCLFMIGVLIGQTLAGTLWVGVLLGIGLAFVPYGYLAWMRSRRIQRFEELFPEALDLMSRAMRAGHTFINAIKMVADELPEPIAPEFKLLHDQQNFGMSLDEALRNFGERVPLLTAKFFVTAILTQRESGGNLTEVLDNLASVIRDRYMVMRQVRVKSAHGRITGWVLVGLPPGLALVLGILNPKHFEPMLKDAFGMQMVIGAVVLQVIGALIIRKIVNIDY